MHHSEGSVALPSPIPLLPDRQSRGLPTQGPCLVGDFGALTSPSWRRSIYQKRIRWLVATGHSPIVPKVNPRRPPQSRTCRPARERLNLDRRLAARPAQTGTAVRARQRHGRPTRGQEEGPHRTRRRRFALPALAIRLAVCSRMIRRMRPRHLALPALSLAAALTLAACTAGSPANNATSPQAGVRPSPTRPAGPLVLDAAQASWRLPSPLQRAVVLAEGGRLQILGGLTGAGVSTTAVHQVGGGRLACRFPVAEPGADVAPGLTVCARCPGRRC